MLINWSSIPLAVRLNFFSVSMTDSIIGNTEGY